MNGSRARIQKGRPAKKVLKLSKQEMPLGGSIAMWLKALDFSKEDIQLGNSYWGCRERSNNELAYTITKAGKSKEPMFQFKSKR